jgi:hypothetical protein
VDPQPSTPAPPQPQSPCLLKGRSLVWLAIARSDS